MVLLGVFIPMRNNAVAASIDQVLTEMNTSINLVNSASIEILSQSITSTCKLFAAGLSIDSRKSCLS